MLTTHPPKKMLVVALLALCGIVASPSPAQHMTVASTVPQARFHRKVEVKAAAANAPAYYVEQDNDAGVVLAFTAQGLPAWSWPSSSSGEKAQIAAGARDGGLVAYTTSKDKHFVVSVDRHGRERWRLRTAGMSTSLQSPDGLFYFVEETGHSSELVAVDETGKARFRTPLPVSVVQHLNYDLASDDAYLVCRPGVSLLTEVPSSHGELSQRDGGNVEVAVASIHQTFDGMPCAPNRRLNINKGVLSYDGKLQLFSFHASGSYSAVTLKEFTFMGANWNHEVEIAEPSGAITYDNQGDSLIAGHWLIFRPQTGETVAETQMIYHRVGAQLSEYALPLEVTSAAQESHLVLGEDGTAFLSSGTTVIAFDPENGSVKWKWISKQPSRTLSARTGGGVLVMSGGDTVALDGKGHPAAAGRQ